MLLKGNIFALITKLKYMDLSSFKVGQWIPELGKYKKICALKECRSPFSGRKNKDHCTDYCKTKKNNDKSRRKRVFSKQYNDELYHANNAFLHHLKDKNGINTVRINQLMKSGFYGEAATKKIKNDRFHGEWDSVGSFAYRMKKGTQDIIEFIYIKNEKLWQ
jgi:hypothetical protein